MSLYDIYVDEFWRANPKGKESHDSVVFEKGHEFHEKLNADRKLVRMNTTAKCLTSYGTEVYQATDGRVIEYRLDDAYNKFTAAFYPNQQAWKDYEKPMSFTTWATR